MKPLVSLLSLMVVFAVSYSRHQDTALVCGVSDPVNNLSWLAAQVDSLQSLKEAGQVTVYHVNGQDYINIQLAVQSGMPCGLHSCDGRPLQYPADSLLITSISASGSYRLLKNF